MAESLYIHIPFCMGKCSYCDFTSIVYGEDAARAYIEALKREIHLKGKMGLKTFYIGGGTPTALSAASLKDLFNAVNEQYEFYPDAERTIEANPATIDREKLSLLKGAGVNRVSLGVQSLNADELFVLGRLHSSGQALRSFHLIRDGGFENVSLDLIYGVPGQTLKTWEATLNEILRLRPEHISAYELMLEACTPLYVEVETGLVRMPPEKDVIEMSELCQDLLEGAGYARYEVSNYALPGRESRHNINYWRRGEYIGLGAAAHSFINSERWRNTDDVFEYISSLEKGAIAIKDHETLTPEDEKREFVFLGLRMANGISVKEGEERYGISLASASGELLKDGLLEMEGENLRPTRKGFSVLNAVIGELLKSLGL